MGPKDCAHLESSSPLPTLTNGFLPLLRASADLIPKSILEGVNGTTGGKTPGHRVTKDQLGSLGCPHCPSELRTGPGWVGELGKCQGPALPMPLYSNEEVWGV